MKLPTIAPVFACLYPGLCCVARHHGYALAVHGSLVTDLDLIAVPWVAEAGDPLVLRDALLRHVGACGYDGLLRESDPHLTEAQIQQIVGTEMEVKPHGRMAWNLYLDHGVKIDLSILPRHDTENKNSG